MIEPMNDFERRLADDLRRMTDTAPRRVNFAEEARLIAAGPEESRPRWRRFVPLAVATAALAAVATLVVLDLAPFNRPPTGTASIGARPTPQSPSSTPIADETPAPSLDLTQATAHWRRIALPNPAPPDLSGGASALDIVVYRDAFIAVGGVNGSCCTGGFSEETRALIWKSTDGLAWALLPDAPAFAHGRMNAAAVGPGGVVVVGGLAVPTDESGDAGVVSAAWFSTDGLTWLQTPIDGRGALYDVIAVGDGFVGLGGGDRTDPSTVLWTSPDGRTWNGVPAEDVGITPKARPNALVLAPDGTLVMVGTSDPDQGGNARAVVWLSANGSTWEQAADQPSFAGAHMTSVAATSDGLVAGGATQDGQSVIVWRSTDGRRWSRDEGGDLSGEGSIDAMLGAPKSLAIGSTYSPGGQVPALWSYESGSWRKALEREPVTSGEARAVTKSGALVIAVGVASERSQPPAPAAWVIEPGK